MACGLSSDKLLGNEVKSHSQRENKLKGNCKIKKVLEKCRGGVGFCSQHCSDWNIKHWLRHKNRPNAEKEACLIPNASCYIHADLSMEKRPMHPVCMIKYQLQILKKKSSGEQTKSLAECSWAALRQRLQRYSHLNCTAVKVQKWNCHIIQGHITLAALIKVTQAGWHAVLWGVKLSMSTHTFCWPWL